MTINFMTYVMCVCCAAQRKMSDSMSSDDDFFYEEEEGDAETAAVDQYDSLVSTT